ncbi:MAG: ribosomal L7Ae/L30e/S12e/Gadd45 family protein [Lachnospiraceae bacterium]|jgi:ribosomal protein L7Ae-like RNA K-turn-binding protein|nr:ribosomal L7Ae/L30e/S12e/Gadd45 family protein [Lachnospiraceae bacterium]
MPWSKGENKAFSLLGLAKKAGKIGSGEFKTEKLIKTNLATLVIIAEDASDNTKKKFANMCDFYDIDYIIFADKETLANVIGETYRAMLAITDLGFSTKIKNLLMNSKEDIDVKKDSSRTC